MSLRGVETLGLFQSKKWRTTFVFIQPLKFHFIVEYYLRIHLATQFEA